MQIKGIKSDMFTAIVAHVSTNVYGGNVCTDYWRTATSPTLLNTAGTRFRARVIVKDSHGEGARRSASGRRMPAACWHVFRDVVRACLAYDQAIEFRTSMAHYTSGNFEATYPATGSVNIGSMLSPVRMPDLCECTDQPESFAPIVQREACQPHRVMERDEFTSATTTLAPAHQWAAERDQQLAIAASECAWCGGSTAHLGDVFAWCRPECQSLWQDKYGAGLAS